MPSGTRDLDALVALIAFLQLMCLCFCEWSVSGDSDARSSSRWLAKPD